MARESSVALTIVPVGYMSRRDPNGDRVIVADPDYESEVKCTHGGYTNQIILGKNEDGSYRSTCEICYMEAMEQAPIGRRR